MSLQVRPNRHSANSAASTNLTSVRATPCRLRGVFVSNTGAAARFLKLYDKASAPVPASDTPLLVVPVGANGVVSLHLGDGIDFNLGLAYSITGGAADTDATEVGAGEVKVVLLEV